MQTTIDKAGRVVIPKELREAIGLTPGPVDIRVEGASLRIEVPTSAHLEQKGDVLLIAPQADSVPVSDDELLKLRDAGRK